MFVLETEPLNVLHWNLTLLALWAQQLGYELDPEIGSSATVFGKHGLSRWKRACIEQTDCDNSAT